MKEGETFQDKIGGKKSEVKNNKSISDRKWKSYHLLYSLKNIILFRIYNVDQFAF